MKRSGKFLKAIFMFCALILLTLGHNALAADESIFVGDWSQVQQQVTAAGLEGNFINLDKVDLQMWVPSFMIPRQLTDKDKESGLIGVYADPKSGGACFVSYRDEENYPLDDYADFLKETSSAHAEEHVLNGIRTVGRRGPDDDFAAVTAATEKGYYIEFTYTDWDDDHFRQVAGYMISSIQPADEEGDDQVILADGTQVPEETDAPQTQAAQTEQPQTEQPQTQAPQTEQPQTQPQTEEPQTQAPQTEEPQTQAPEEETKPAEQAANKSGDTWTFLMYFCGADLESDNALASDNFQEMMDAGVGDNIKILIETGGAYEWHNSNIKSGEIGRYLVQDGGLVKVDSQPDASMGSSSTLEDFISYGMENYPADKTALIMWDHGGGVLGGVCYDERHQDDCLSVERLQQVFEKEKGFEFVGFDTCLTASLEYAQALGDSADYMVASQESEPGAGWDYKAFLSYLNSNPTVDGEALGKVIVDSYYDKCQRDGNGDQATLSVVDLSKVPKVTKAFAGYTDELVQITNDSQKMADYSQEAEKAESFGGNSFFEGYTDMIDLEGLAENTGDFTPGSYNQLASAVKEAVLYSKAGSVRSGAHGISVFYPYYMNDEIYSNYSDISDNESYLQYLSVVNGNSEDFNWDDIYGGDISSLLPVDPDNYSVTSEVSQNDNGDNVLTITNGADSVSSVKYDIAIYDDDTGKYLFLGSDDELEGDSQSGVYTEHFNGQWFGFDDTPVCALLTEETDQYNLYSIPAKINGDVMVIKAEYLWDEQRFKVLGADGVYDMSTWMSERTSVNLQDGDKVEFISFEFDPVALDFDMTEHSLGTITWTDDTEMSMGPFDSGKYLYVFQIEDIFGNVYFSTPIEEET